MCQMRAAFVLLAVAAAALVAHSLVFNFVTDDAFISFVYSRNLAEHGQLVFNLGEHVEGYTNFLWTVVLAVLYKLGLQPEITSRVLGTGFGVATLGTCAYLSRALRGGAWQWWDAVPALFLAGVPGYACWSSGGLETQMFTFFVTLGAALYLTDRLPRAAIAFGLAALTRPEGILFFALTGLHFLITRRRLVLRPILIFAAIVVPHLLWRRWYYGWWLPNTFYIKSSGGAGTWGQGAYYLRRFAEDFHLWAFAAAALLAARLRSYVFLVGGIFFVYVASVGGDFMGLYRFALPIVPLLIVAAALGMRPLLERFPYALIVLFALHGWHAWKVDQHANRWIGADRGIDTPAFLRWYTADRAAIGKWFGAHVRPDDYAAVGGAGAQVWYSHTRSLDCFGLSDEHIAHKVPAMSNRPGHQKYAPDDYILSKNPTIITSHNYRIHGLQHYEGPDAQYWNQHGYRYVTARVAGLSSPYYSFLLRSDRHMADLDDAEREP
jgi:arabinofuranosyltransferase